MTGQVYESDPHLLVDIKELGAGAVQRRFQRLILRRKANSKSCRRTRCGRPSCAALSASFCAASPSLLICTSCAVT